MNWVNIIIIIWIGGWTAFGCGVCYQLGFHRGRTKRDDCKMWCNKFHKMILCQFTPPPDARTYWRCSQCGEIAAGDLRA